MGLRRDATKVVKMSDVVLFVLDARMPEKSRNEDLELEVLKSRKKIFIVFNKIDLVDEKRLRFLRGKYPEALFVSSTTKKGINDLRIELYKIGKKMKIEKLEVGIVGYPNVGKSRLTNLLIRGSSSKVSSKAGTTIGVQWASSNRFKISDSPGVIPYGDDEIKLGILGAKNPEKLKDPESVAMEIIGMFLKENREGLEKFYNFKIKDENDEYEILLQIGEERKMLRKGGVVNENGTSLMIIRDWQTGRLKLG